MTLVLSPDAGNYLPELPTAALDPPLYNLECANANDPYSCAAKTNILSYFLYKGGQDGPDAKVARVGGMTRGESPYGCGTALLALALLA